MAGIMALAAAPLAAQPAAPGFDAQRSAALTPGDWTYIVTATGSEARFGSAFVIRCERMARLVLLLRRAAPGPAAPMIIITDSASRSFASGEVRIKANDPLLDAIAFSRGRTMVSGGGSATLILPSWPEAARSIEDCRN